MHSMKEILERTSLRALGAFVTDDSIPLGELLEEAATQEEQARRFTDDLHLAIRNGGAQAEERAQRVLVAGRDAAWQAGFCAGMKAGARIVLSLTDEGEVVC